MSLLSRVTSASGAAPLLISAAISGGAGYVISALVPALETPAVYAAFTLVWSAQFLGAAALGGIQQEIGRVALPADGHDHAPTSGREIARMAGVLAVVAGLLAALVVAVLALCDVLPGAAVAPVTVACAAFACVSVVLGMLYGLGRTGVIALEIVVEWGLRFLLVVVTLALDGGTAVLLWAIALPTLLAPFVIWPWIRAGLGGGVWIAGGLTAVRRTLAYTVGSSSASAVLISGFPIMVAVMAGAAQDPRLPAIILAITLVRSPIVVLVIGLQAMLVVRIRDLGDHYGALLRTWHLGLLGVSLVAALGAGLLGPPVLELFGSSYHLPGLFLAGLVLASGVLGCLSITSAATLARGMHGRYLAGWIGAVVAAAVALVPRSVELETRVVVSLFLAAGVGWLIHAAGLRRDLRAPGRIEVPA